MSGDGRWPGSSTGPVRAGVGRIVVVGVVAVGAAGVVVGVVGLAAGAPDPGRVSPVSPAAGSSGPVEMPSALPARGCRQGSAARLALLPLTWDSSTGSRAEEVHRVLAAAEPDGDEGSGLVQDLDGYLPDEAVWEQLAVDQTRQRATISSLSTPSSWGSILSANRARLGSRAEAFTVHAVRRREGTLDGVAEVATDEVSFTIFVSCPRGSTRFRLTRLSRLDHPLP